MKTGALFWLQMTHTQIEVLWPIVSKSNTEFLQNLYSIFFADHLIRHWPVHVDDALAVKIVDHHVLPGGLILSILLELREVTIFFSLGTQYLGLWILTRNPSFGIDYRDSNSWIVVN